MQDALDHIKSIDLKINRLAQRLEALRDENVQLGTENQNLTTDLDQLRKDHHALGVQLEEAMRVSKIRHQAADDKRRVQKELGQYIKEIDKCIKLMHEL